MTSVLQKQFMTWFTRPYHDRTSEIVLGVGKSLMVAVYLAAGLIPSLVMRKPTNSISRLTNLNFGGVENEHQAALVTVGEHTANLLESFLD